LIGYFGWEKKWMSGGGVEMGDGRWMGKKNFYMVIDILYF
jgi:hypothetical protein